jgi:hypothetical protein
VRPAIRLCLALLCAGGIAGLFAATPATALEGEKIVISATPGSKVTKSYGPMPVPDTAGVLTTPEDCALSPACTLVPMEVQLPPGFDSFINEFFLQMTISWEGNIDLGAAGTADLDIYIYAKRLNDDGEEEYVEVGRAASAGQPEQTKLFTPDETNYWIVVQNFNGANPGFTIDVEFVDATIVDPLFSPSFTNPGPSPEDDEVFGDAPTSPAREPAPYEPTQPASLPSLAPPAVAGDPMGLGFTATPGDAGLGDFGSFRDFQRELAAGAEPTRVDLLAASRRKLGPAEDVGAPVLFFWLLALPAAAFGGAFVLLMRRRPAALKISV